MNIFRRRETRYDLQNKKATSLLVAGLDKCKVSAGGATETNRFPSQLIVTHLLVCTLDRPPVILFSNLLYIINI